MIFSSLTGGDRSEAADLDGVVEEWATSLVANFNRIPVSLIELLILLHPSSRRAKFHYCNK